MSDAVFYYYPDAGGTLETVTITADAGGLIHTAAEGVG